MNAHIGELEREKLAHAKAIHLKLMGKPTKKIVPLALPEPKKPIAIMVDPATMREPPPIAPIEEWPIEEFHLPNAAKGLPIRAEIYLRQRCKASGLQYSDIIGGSRQLKDVHPRHVLMYEVAMLYPEKSLPQIGKMFGRDHTTALHAFRKIQQMVKTQDLFDIRPDWVKVLLNPEKIKMFRDAFMRGDRREDIMADQALSLYSVDKVIAHQRWVRRTRAFSQPKEIEDIEQLRKDYENGMEVRDIADKHGTYVRRVYALKSLHKWNRKARVLPRMG